jgi:S1-C subfamily serine protease
MTKIIGVLCSLGILIFFLIFNTPVTRLGSGFLIGSGSYVFTYHDLVKEADSIKVVFPNEDDIPATLLYQDTNHNLAVLQLTTEPKVKPIQLKYFNINFRLKSEYVYTLGYPWTNTMEDTHELINGSTSLKHELDLIPITMPLNSINSGGPLFNSNNDLVGMLLHRKHAASFYEFEKIKNYNYAIPASTIISVMDKLKLKDKYQVIQKLPKESFIEATRKNIVLIEAY